MPTVKIEWIEGRSIRQKRELASAITALVANIAKTNPERVKVEYRDIPKSDLAWGGILRFDEDERVITNE